MTIATITLPTTRTFAVRDLTFIRLGIPGLLRGVVEIREATSKTAKVHVSRYAMAEQPSPDPGCRVFRFAKPGGAVLYTVALPLDDREFPVCECMGYEKHGRCKHIDALYAMRKAGQLPTE